MCLYLFPDTLHTNHTHRAEGQAQHHSQNDHHYRVSPSSFKVYTDQETTEQTTWECKVKVGAMLKVRVRVRVRVKVKVRVCVPLLF